MRRTILFFISLAVLFAGCGGLEMQIKDAYVYSPVSHLKAKYPIKVVISGKYVSKEVILKDDISQICKTELESLKLFTEVGNKASGGYDVGIDMDFSEAKVNGKPGLVLNISMKQFPDKKLIYKTKYSGAGEDDSYKNSEQFAALLKNVITQFTTDIDAKFALYAKEGNLPVNRSGKEVICAVFKFKDTVENEQYGDAVSGIMMANLTKTENVKIVERDRIQQAVNELQLQSSGISDPDNAKKVGQFLNADFLIYGDVSKIKNTYHIVMHVVDVKLGQIVISKDISADDPDKFDQIIQQQANYVSQFVSR